MARRKQHSAKLTLFYCGMCSQSFTSKVDLNHHTQNHPENGPVEMKCPKCYGAFPDSVALERHCMQNNHYAEEEPIECNRCSNTFPTRKEYDNHRSFQVDGPCADHNWRTPPKNRVGYVDPDEPIKTMNKALLYDNERKDVDGSYCDTDSDVPTTLSNGNQWCGRCKTEFDSMAKYHLHCLRCATTDDRAEKAPPIQQNLRVQTANNSRSVCMPRASSSCSQHQLPARPPARAQAPSPAQHQLPVRPKTPSQAPISIPSPVPTSQTDSVFTTITCNINGCQKLFRSNAGLKQHKADAHGVGGQAVDIRGRDSWMLTARVRDQLKAAGLLQAPSGAGRGRSQGVRGIQPIFAGPSGPSRARGREQSRMNSPITTPIFKHPTPATTSSSRTPQPSRTKPNVHRPLADVPTPTSRNMGGPLEMEQAKNIHRDITRLLIQSDIFIHHDGKMTVCGIDWTRIGFEKQRDVTEMFGAMCHLPRILQGEYLPRPKAFQDEHEIQYPVMDFEPSPARDNAKPGLSVVVLCCIKVVLANGLQDVVKVAAIDLSTCRILMNHLVCTDPQAQVAEWCTKDTGLSSWYDMNQAYKQGYKVFKGWSAVRSALWKFVDKDTIIVGHNLRSDLDALRMVHGRAVDIARVTEKAAKGPLSKQQLSLDSLCLNFPAVTLKSDPDFGRDALMNAFATREMGLWIIKNREKFERNVQQKSLDYQRVFTGT